LDPESCLHEDDDRQIITFGLQWPQDFMRTRQLSLQELERGCHLYRAVTGDDTGDDPGELCCQVTTSGRRLGAVCGAARAVRRGIEVLHLPIPPLAPVNTGDGAGLRPRPRLLRPARIDERVRCSSLEKALFRRGSRAVPLECGHGLMP